jgi:hypothetical protein
MIDLRHSLLRVCALPPSAFTDVMRTSDGHYLAERAGDIGFNAFLGAPNPRPQPATTRLAWSAFRVLTLTERRSLVRLARSRNVRIRDFLLRKGA